MGKVQAAAKPYTDAAKPYTDAALAQGQKLVDKIDVSPLFDIHFQLFVWVSWGIRRRSLKSRRGVYWANDIPSSKRPVTILTQLPPLARQLLQLPRVLLRLTPMPALT